MIAVPRIGKVDNARVAPTPIELVSDTQPPGWLAFDVISALRNDVLAEGGGKNGRAGDAVDAACFAAPQRAFEVLLQGADHADHQLVAEAIEVHIEEVSHGGLA
ncbi:hypothetical protein ACFYRD_38655 [Streptomyces hirsutus]|uniref:hypothetical protein n=1 Tax=Streptomyces hirsutus TaxID=35620 RepID=UPI0036BAC170